MKLFVFLFACNAVFGDIFMTNPRGSNNRLNERSTNRKNANRLFDSQNNNKGGYNVGDRYADAAGNDPRKQYQIQYYESGPSAQEASKLMIEWSNQHGCGTDNPKSHCNIVVQYMCMSNLTDTDYPSDEGKTAEDDKKRGFYMRDGIDTTTQKYYAWYSRPGTEDTETDSEFTARMKTNYQHLRAGRGLHESLEYFDMCRHREANNGLFRAATGVPKTTRNNLVIFNLPKSLQIADEIVARGVYNYDIVKSTSPSFRFGIDIYSGPNEVAGHFVFRPAENVLVMNNKKEGIWGKEVRATFSFSKLQIGEKFQVRVLVRDDDYEVYFKGGDREEEAIPVTFPQRNNTLLLDTKSVYLSGPESTEGTMKWTYIDVRQVRYAKRTRQNPDGVRRGYECPEERDYYPYWAPTVQGPYCPKYQRTPWLDAGYLGAGCKQIIKESFNTKGKYSCIYSTKREYGRAINQEACEAQGGKWVKFISYLEVLESITTEEECEAVNNGQERNVIKWTALRSDSEDKKCVVQAAKPKCGMIPQTRVNHLGNSPHTANNASRFEWELPHFPSGDAKRCVIRVRYNISTADYDAYNTFADQNGVNSPITKNPEIYIFGTGKGLKLSINPAQFGRTFQDRSHVFVVLPRTEEMRGKTLHNLNVRGQRGNIVQNFPAVEYDFVPDQLTVEEDDLVHIQWAGHNTNVANRAGQGKDGTDRNNFVEMSGDPDTSFPYLISEAPFWENVESLTAPGASGEDIAVALASAGYYCGRSESDTCPAESALDNGDREALNNQLDNAPASYFGHVLRFKGPGKAHYLCTRNNSFTNRSQKGSIFVKAAAASKP